MTYALLPLIKTLDEMICTIRVCMVSGKEFEKDMKKNLVFCAIIPREPSYSNNDQMTEASISQVTDNNDQVPTKIQRFL